MKCEESYFTWKDSMSLNVSSDPSKDNTGSLITKKFLCIPMEAHVLGNSMDGGWEDNIPIVLTVRVGQQGCCADIQSN